MAISTVIVAGDGVQYEATANGAITPGHVIQLESTGKVAVHGNAGQNAEKAFAIENELEGQGITDAYADGDLVQYRIFAPGDRVYAILTTSQTVAIGEYLESAGNGTLREHSATSAGAVEYPNAIIGVAMEAVTTTAATARIKIRIV